jgi:hypothetical protein
MIRAGDKVIVKNRASTYSKFLMRKTGYQYWYTTWIVQGIIGDVLVVLSDKGEDVQLVTKKDWELVLTTKRNWRDDA